MTLIDLIKDATGLGDGTSGCELDSIPVHITDIGATEESRELTST